MRKSRANSSASSLKGAIASRYRYEQLAEQLQREIHSDYAPGAQFPSEEALGERFKLNRQTVHRAILLLEERKLLVRKGRAGTFVADVADGGFDNRLIAVALALRNHIWDGVFLALANHAVKNARFPLVCDFSGTNIANPFADRLSFPQMQERLRGALGWHPRTLVTDLAEWEREALKTQTGEQLRVRNLVVLNQGRVPGFQHCASVTANRIAAFQLQGHCAALSGYKRVCVLLPHIDATLPHIQNAIKSGSNENFSPAQQHVIYQDVPTWTTDLIALARASNAPLAVLASYDYGAYLALKALQEAGIAAGTAGCYGTNNTPWSTQHGLSSVGFDPDHWAAEVFAAIDELDHSGIAADRLVPPTFYERRSTLPLPSTTRPAADMGQNVYPLRAVLAL